MAFLAAPGSARPIFNGQSWVTPPGPTPAEQQQAQRTQEQQQARFSSTTRSVVDELLNTQAETARLDRDTEAAGFSAQGYAAEVAQYTAAAQTASSNADLAGENGKLQAFQSARALMTTVGAQRAQVAGNGFKNSGSALYLAQSAYQKGNLEQQIDVLNGNLKAGGYMEQAAANRAEAGGASIASNAAIALQSADAAAATTSRTNSGNLSTAMNNYFSRVDPSNLTPEDQLTMSLLSSNPDTALNDTVTRLQASESSNPGTNIDDAAGGGGTPVFDGNNFQSQALGRQADGQMRNLGFGVH